MSYEVHRLFEICERVEKSYVVVRESSFVKDFACLLEEPVRYISPPISPTTNLTLSIKVRYSDVSFLIEDEEIKSHKVFLAAR